MPEDNKDPSTEATILSETRAKVLLPAVNFTPATEGPWAGWGVTLRFLARDLTTEMLERVSLRYLRKQAMSLTLHFGSSSYTMHGMILHKPGLGVEREEGDRVIWGITIAVSLGRTQPKLISVFAALALANKSIGLSLYEAQLRFPGLDEPVQEPDSLEPRSSVISDEEAEELAPWAQAIDEAMKLTPPEPESDDAPE